MFRCIIHQSLPVLAQFASSFDVLQRWESHVSGRHLSVLVIPDPARLMVNVLLRSSNQEGESSRVVR